MKKIIVFLAIGVMLGLAGSILAVGFSPSSLQAKKASILEQVRTKTHLKKEEFQAKRLEVRKLIQKRQQEWRDLVKEKREEAKERIKAKRDELRNRLKNRIQARKQKIVERIYDRVNNLNERMTNHYLKVLDKLDNLLERIESRTAKAELNGLDVSKVEEAIEKAHEAIEKAREAVEVQAQKVYAPEITTEENLRVDVGKIRQGLHKDLVATRNLVKEAFMAVKAAAVALAQIPRINELDIATSTQPSQ